MQKDYSTYMTLMNTNENNSLVLNHIMEEWLNYQTHRYVHLKKNDLLGNYDKLNCDAYRKTQTFDSEKEGIFKGKKTEKFDARYSRAIDIDIQARVESQIEVKKLEIDDKLIKLEAKTRKKEKALEKYRNTKENFDKNIQGFSQEKVNQEYHHYNYSYQQEQTLLTKIEQLKKDIEEKNVNIVFGGKKLWKKQFKKESLDPNVWKEAWKNRGDRFDCGGSKSEEFGNKKFQLTFSKEYDPTSKKRTKFDLKIMIPTVLQEHYGKSMTISNLVFNHGEESIRKNVENHTLYKKLMNDYTKDFNKIKKMIQKIMGQFLIEKKPSILLELQEKIIELSQAFIDLKSNKPKADDYQLTSFAFQILRKNNKFYCHISMPRDTSKIQTSAKKGVIGVDINYNNISYSITNKKGDLLNSKVLRFNFGHKDSSSHREQMINQCIKELTNIALHHKKDIVIEKLDFTHVKSKASKSTLHEKKYNRMIHSLAYKKIKENIRIQCLEKGISLHQVNPAYTSMIGKLLYTKQYGISTHQGAAFAIARRYLKKKETFSKILNFIYKDKACSFEIPERIFENQDKLKPFKFYNQLYVWIGKEFKAPSRFYQETLTS